jgi:hypothetical protein
VDEVEKYALAMGYFFEDITDVLGNKHRIYYEDKEKT